MSSSQPPYWNQPAYPGGPPPHHGPPKKGNGLLIALLSVLVLVIVAGATTLVLVLGNDDSEDTASEEESSSETTEDAPDAASEGASDDPGDDASEASEQQEGDEEQSGTVLTGSGYAFAIPEGWSDASDHERVTGSLDSAIAEGTSLDTAKANIMISSTPAQGLTDPEATRAKLRSDLQGENVSGLEDIEDREIDGEKAIGVRRELDEAGTDLFQVAYLTIVDDRSIGIVLTVADGRADEGVASLEQVLDSWSWQ